MRCQASCLSPRYKSTLHHAAFAEQTPDYLRPILAARMEEKRQKEPPKYVAKCRC